MRGGPAHDGLTDFIESVTNMSKKAKYALCKMHGGPADCPPVMLWKGETDEAIEICALPMPSDEEEQLSAPALFDNALKSGWVQFGKPTYVGFVSEAYMRVMSENDTKKYKRGDIQRAYKSGVNTNINEILSIVCFTPDGKSEMRVVIVKYDDNGLPEYETYDEKSPVNGAIMDVINDFVKFVNAE